MSVKLGELLFRQHKYTTIGLPYLSQYATRIVPNVWAVYGNGCADSFLKILQQAPQQIIELFLIEIACKYDCCAVFKLYFFFFGFHCGVVMFHFTGNSDKSIRIAGVTVPISELLNNDEDVYSTFYTNTFTDENITNAMSKLSSVADELFLKTELEAQAGAKIVFWSELNGAVLKQDEDMLLQRASDMAKQEEIYLIVSLLVKTPYVDLKENKTAAFNPQGELISEYFKYGRSIGELCQKGDGVLKSFDTEYGRVAPFICSDMAFVSKIRQAGKDNVDILIVPASDWKEMTLLASKTAIVRGVENGSNIIRHTNKGMSIVSDFKGSVLAQTDYFQSDTKTLSAQVTMKGRFTLYSYIGNLFVYLCSIYLLGSVIIPKIKRLL